MLAFDTGNTKKEANMDACDSELRWRWIPCQHVWARMHKRWSRWSIWQGSTHVGRGIYFLQHSEEFSLWIGDNKEMANWSDAELYGCWCNSQNYKRNHMPSRFWFNMQRHDGVVVCQSNIFGKHTSSFVALIEQYEHPMVYASWHAYAILLSIRRSSW